MAADPQFDPLLSDAEAIRLAGRLTYGVDRTTSAMVRKMGYEAFVERQLDYERIDDGELESALEAELPTLSMSISELSQFVRSSDDPRVRRQPQLELLVATLLRRALSPRQLYERMVEFWSDHFNAPVENLISGLFKVSEDRDVIRAGALGRFEDLLLADARSPAMLYYLDNFNSTVRGPNENYSRELMELHTLGVDGGFTENDVKEAARVLTGWSFRDTGDFVFRPFAHDYEEKEFLGEYFPAGVGEEEGVRLLSMLAHHPSTAVHIATKLTRRFVSDQPSVEVVDAVAGTFTSSGGDIRETMRTLLLHPEVRSAPAQKLKRPGEFIAGLVRGLEVRAGQDVIRGSIAALEASGHLPFRWPAPNGYPDVRPFWQSSTGFLVRFNTAATWTGAVDRRSPVLAVSRAFRNVDQQIEFIQSALVPQGLSPDSQAAIAAYAATLPQAERPAAIAALMLSAGMLLDWLGTRHRNPALNEAWSALEAAIRTALGDDASRTPRRVIQVLDGGKKVVVEGVNLVYKHVKRGHP
ncbi:MAG: DUF1800 family protein, partial [Xanthomonadales bacterium]|nr:DUF1800 family protein [Xanthomonadales bacterium]